MVCLAYRHSLSIIILVATQNCRYPYPGHEGKKIALHCKKNQLTGKWRIQEIREIFGVFLGVAETIVCQLLCCGVGIVQCLFNLLYYVIGVRNTKKPPIFVTLVLVRSFIKYLVGHKYMGKRIKRKIQILLRFVRQVVRGVACHAMFTTQ